MQPYSPEGVCEAPPSLDALRKGAGTGEIFQANCVKCDEYHNLHVDLGPIRGLIPREEACASIPGGTVKEYAILSRVGKGVCFQVLAFDSRGNAILSRKAAQLEAKEFILSALRPGDVIPAVVLNPAPFGVFCDIGCGISALMRISRCCVSRLQTTADLFHTGTSIYAAILSIDDQKEQIQLTGRELLGTWEENAARLRPGQTVPGVVRSVMPYGVFVELSPNLSGLAEQTEGVKPGDAVSVYIRAIQPDSHKIKLNILEVLPGIPGGGKLDYYVTQGHLDRWEYYPGSTTATIF